MIEGQNFSLYHWPVYWLAAWLTRMPIDWCLDLGEKLWKGLPDDCELCGGRKGGILGNENLVPYVRYRTFADIGQKNGEPVQCILCDYCDAEISRED